MARADVDELTIKKEDSVEVFFGKKGRFSISIDTYGGGDVTINVYDNSNSNGQLVTLYNGSFKDFRKLLANAKETSESTGTATAF